MRKKYPDDPLTALAKSLPPRQTRAEKKAADEEAARIEAEAKARADRRAEKGDRRAREALLAQQKADEARRRAEQTPSSSTSVRPDDVSNFNAHFMIIICS